MGAGLRIFIVTENDSLQRLSVNKYERLLRYEPQEFLPQYAGKRIRYALIMVENIKRRPVKIIQKQYSYLVFDSNGRLDPIEREKAFELAKESRPPVLCFQGFPNIIDAKHRFAKNSLHPTAGPDLLI